MICLGRFLLGRSKHQSSRRTNSDVEKAKSQLKLLWISCGNKDGLIRTSQNIHQFLKKNNIDHVWHVDGHGHDPAH
ncbi:MAG: LdpA C-terminal domain-containing domain [Pirellulales bacterium]